MWLYGTYWWDHKLLSPTLDGTQMTKLNIPSFEPTIEPKKNEPKIDSNFIKLYWSEDWTKQVPILSDSILSDRIGTCLVQSSLQYSLIKFESIFGSFFFGSIVGSNEGIFSLVICVPSNVGESNLWSHQ